MWGQELGFGTTVYLTENRQYHAATIASFNFQSKKEDSDTQVGNAMNLEGGFGGDFLKGGLTAGLAYYATFKLSDDTIRGPPGILIRGKNKVFALGPEATLALARKNTVYGFRSCLLRMGSLRAHDDTGRGLLRHRHAAAETTQAADQIDRTRREYVSEIQPHKEGLPVFVPPLDEVRRHQVSGRLAAGSLRTTTP